MLIFFPFLIDFMFVFLMYFMHGNCCFITFHEIAVFISPVLILYVVMFYSWHKGTIYSVIFVYRWCWWLFYFKKRTLFHLKISDDERCTVFSHTSVFVSQCLWLRFLGIYRAFSTEIRSFFCKEKIITTR